MVWCMAWCMGLVRLDVGFGSSLDGDGEELVGGVSCEMENYFCFSLGCVFT